MVDYIIIIFRRMSRYLKARDRGRRRSMRNLITLSQIIDSQEKKGPAHEQKDLSYAKSSLRTRMDEKLGVHKHHGGFGNYQTECCQHHSKVL